MLFMMSGTIASFPDWSGEELYWPKSASELHLSYVLKQSVSSTHHSSICVTNLLSQLALDLPMHKIVMMSLHARSVSMQCSLLHCVTWNFQHFESHVWLKLGCISNYVSAYVHVQHVTKTFPIVGYTPIYMQLTHALL